VAVTAGLVHALEDGRLSDRQAGAIMIHDVLTAPATAMRETPAA